MPIEPRTALIPTDPRLWSSHLRGDGTRARLVDTNGGGFGPAVVIAQLLDLDRAVWHAGGRMYVGQLIRSWEDQQKALDEGRSQVGPGRSPHQGGCAVDASWPGLTDEQFVEIATGLGWATIPNDKPHWEWRGAWQRLRDAHGPEQMSMAMVLDGVGLTGGQTYAGNGLPPGGTDAEAARQAQLWRVLREGCGKIDGIAGTKTWTALDAIGMAKDAGYRDLHPMRSAA